MRSCQSKAKLRFRHLLGGSYKEERPPWLCAAQLIPMLGLYYIGMEPPRTLTRLSIKLAELPVSVLPEAYYYHRLA